MSWDYHHSEGEEFASAAEAAAREGDAIRAAELYRIAANAERCAADNVDPAKVRTLGITLVSAVALYYKAHEYSTAQELAQKWLLKEHIPAFARDELRNILNAIRNDPNWTPEIDSSNQVQGAVLRDANLVPNEISATIHSKYSNRNRISHIRRFFWFCSGASVSILEKPECATEQDKYVGIGVCVFFAALLAASSGGFAVYCLNHSMIVVGPIGLIWGLIIFNFDRFILGSMRKHERNIREQLVVLIPHVIFTILISLTIVKPFQLAFLEKEILSQIAQDHLRLSADVETKVAERFNEIEQLQIDNRSLRQGIVEKEKKRDQLYETLEAEATGRLRSGVTSVAGHGPYVAVRSQLAVTIQELEELRAQSNREIQNNEERISRLQEIKDAEVAHAKQILEQPVGFLARLSALQSLEKNSTALVFVDWAMVLLFFFIFISPVVVCFLSAAGPYDAILDRTEQELLLLENRALSNLEMQRYIDAEIIGETKRIILEAKYKLEEVPDLGDVEDEFRIRFASQMRRQLRERLETLSDVLPS